MQKKKEKKAPADMAAKFQALRAELNQALVERSSEIDGLLIALLAREHVLLLGPPGTAKSMTVKLLTQVIDGCFTFSRLLTRFSLPEELFGPFSVKGIKEDRYERITRRKLPEANLAFLDEIFKANSSILNALLALLNEREFDNDTATMACPLETCVGASNELPESEELQALYDRFMLRFWTSYIADRGDMKDLLMAGDAALSTRMTLEELHQAQAEVDQVSVSEEIVDLLLEVKAALEKGGFVNSDRRWVKCLRVLQASAWLDRRTEVSEDDVLVLQHVMWREPKDRGALSQTISALANPLAHAATEILDAMKEEYRALPIGQTVPDSQSSAVLSQSVEANQHMKAAIAKLEKLSNGKRSGAVEAAIAELEAMRTQVIDFGNKVSGLT